jgi:hypothetical protein
MRRGTERRKGREANETYNLELDGLRVEVNRANLEVDTDGGDVRFSVRVVGETQQQARLADAGVADQQKFEEVVAGTG